MRQLLLVVWALLLVCAGCKEILGIDERKLDVAQLTADGYEGCEPSDGVCDGCTSEWHRCVCDGWKEKDEAELRVDCAVLAPESIRSEAVREADEALEEAQRGNVQNPFLRTFDEDFCEEPPEDDACLTCFCGDCGQAVGECASDKQCQPIMNCFMASDCDPTKDGPGGCAEHEACGDVIDENGGEAGEAYDKFKLAIKCVIDEQCPCGDGGGPPNTQACNAEDGCDQCGNCWERCFCEGKDQGQCQQECGNPDCVPERECMNCVDCMDSCLCAGDGDPAECTQMCFFGGTTQCSPNNQCNCPDCLSRCNCEQRGADTCEQECGGANVCNPSSGCEGCFDCFSSCLCEGGSEADCASSCPTPALCDPLDNCAGCSTCVGTCACEGDKPFHECLTSCDVASCGGDQTGPDCGSCSTCTSECGCEGKGALDCRTECVTASCNLTFSEPCDRCACDRCGFEFAACDEQLGCPELMGCITRTGCFNPDDCARPATCEAEVIGVGGINSPAMGVVEALQACRMREGCGCGPVNQPPGQALPIQCGDQQCNPFVPPAPDPIASACCAGPMLLCGLEMNSVLGNGNFCAPRGGPGTLDETCPDHRPDTPPWLSSDVLAGCCRPDGRCGFQDFVMDLGCAPSEAFGIQNPPTCSP